MYVNFIILVKDDKNGLTMINWKIELYHKIYDTRLISRIYQSHVNLDVELIYTIVQYVLPWQSI